MINWFNKKKVTKVEIEKTKWTYSICVDNVPENDLSPIKFGTLQTGYLEDIVIPRVGERICCKDWDKVICGTNKELLEGILIYTGVVKEVFYNYPLNFVCITFDCEEVKKTWK